MAWGGGLVPVGGSGSGGGSTLTIEEGDVSVLNPVTTVDFDGTAFNITGASGEANVAMNFGLGAGQPTDGAVFADHSGRHESGGADPLGGTIHSVARFNILKDGTIQGTQRGLNVIPGANITSTFVDVPGSNQVNWFLDATGGSGGGGGAASSDISLRALADAATNITGVMKNDAGVVMGAITAQTSPNTTVKMAELDARKGGRPYRFAAIAASPTMPANGSNPMYYTISINPATPTVLTATAGTPAASPDIPAWPATDIPLAAVFRATSDATIASGDITDLRYVVEKPSMLNVIDWYGYVSSSGNDINPMMDAAIIDAIEFQITRLYLRGDRGVIYWGRGVDNLPVVIPLGMGIVGDGGFTRSGNETNYVGTEIVVKSGTVGPILQDYTAVVGYVNGGNDYCHGLVLRGLRFHGKEVATGSPQNHAGGNMIELGTLGEVHDIDDISVYTSYGHGLQIKASRTSGNGIVSSTPLDLGHMSFHSNGQGNALGIDGDGAGLAIINQQGTSTNIRFLAGDNNTQCLGFFQGNGSQTGGNVTIANMKSERKSENGHPASIIIKDHNGGNFAIQSARIRSNAGLTAARAWILCRLPNPMPNLKIPTGIQEGDAGGSTYTYAIESENTTQLANITPAQLKYMSYFGRGLRVDGYAAGGVPAIQLGDSQEVMYGTTSPEGSWTANPGAMYLRSVDGTLFHIYTKHTGTGNTGWVGLMQAYSGTTSPEGLTTAPVGAMYVRTQDTAPATLYMKRTGTAATGWIAMIGGLYGSVAFDPPLMPNTLGANTSTTITVTGAAVGNPATAAFSNTIPPGVFLAADVNTANTVTCRFFNFSGTSQDLGAGTLNVFVLKSGA